MKWQFSLATLLLFTAVIAMVCANCWMEPVVDSKVTIEIHPYGEPIEARGVKLLGNNRFEVTRDFERRPTLAEGGLRFAKTFWKACLPFAVIWIVSAVRARSRAKTRT
jgi:hypothetical protein